MGQIVKIVVNAHHKLCNLMDLVSKSNFTLFYSPIHF